MPTPFEIEINSLLREMGDVRSVVDELLRRWNLNLLSESEQETSAFFMMTAGFYPSLFEQAATLCSKGRTLPWTPLIESLGRAGISVNDDEMQALIEGASEQNALSDFLRSHAFDSSHAVLSSLRHQQASRKAVELVARKQALKEKLEFMRNNRLFEQEAKILDEIRYTFPNDPEFKREQNAFDVRWAREVISNSTSVTDPTSDLIYKTERLSPEQLNAKTLIVARAKELAQSHPEAAYDLAIQMHFMEFNVEALEILELIEGVQISMQHSYASDWLRLELKLHARHYVSALEEASRLEMEYASNPEASFALVYARARALWGLGQSSMAIDLLRGLVKIRPHYKSAHSLLMDWTGGEL